MIETMPSRAQLLDIIERRHEEYSPDEFREWLQGARAGLRAEGEELTTTEQEQRTELQFHGEITDLKTVLPKAKENGYSYGVPKSDGRLELTISIEKPLAPSKPQMRYPGDQPRPKPFAGKEPKEPSLKQKADEDAQAFAERTDQANADYARRVAKWNQGKAAAERSLESWERAQAQYREAVERYNAEAAGYGQRLMQYAQLGGIVMALGRHRAEFKIMPLLQDALPGFTAQASLLDMPKAVSPDEDEDEEGYDDGDNDFDDEDEEDGDEPPEDDEAD